MKCCHFWTKNVTQTLSVQKLVFGDCVEAIRDIFISLCICCILPGPNVFAKLFFFYLQRPPWENFFTQFVNQVIQTFFPWRPLKIGKKCLEENFQPSPSQKMQLRKCVYLKRPPRSPQKTEFCTDSVR